MDTSLKETQIAHFFVCPNSDCQTKQTTTVPINKNVRTILMTCSQCSAKGYFAKKGFYYINCKECHNTLFYEDWGKQKKWVEVWYRTWNSPEKRFHINLKNNPCPHCNTYGAGTYIPELPEKERGIQYTTKPWDNINWWVLSLLLMVFIYIIIVLIWG